MVLKEIRVLKEMPGALVQSDQLEVVEVRDHEDLPE